MRILAAILILSVVAIALPPGLETAPMPTAEAETAARRATVPKGMAVSLWAAEPTLMNPVAITFDEKGHCYIAETTRFEAGVPDTRSHMNWLDDDLACRTVEDRLKMYLKFKFPRFDQNDDQIRRVWDSTGKGVADRSTVFARGYNQPQDGLAAGVLARKGDVWFTCIPSLYKFHDNDGVGEKREVLSTGYGVRVQFLGHDLHGLRMGPDGRIYFSIGDRGFNVINKEGKRISNPDSGAVLRCEPDGANLEIVHVGLRNPQKLAFDDYGNLFTFDNNCDAGDKARWVQIVPGGDSGWRCGYQYGTYYHTPDVKEGNRGPWNTEKLWHLQHEGQPAYILPPLAHFGNGPSGIVHYPGVGLNDRYKNHFFACDFTSSPGSSVIWSLECKPKGASFEVTDLHKFVQNMVPTDCEFGPDSNFYWSDWTGGWNPPMKGRIFKVTDAEAQKNPAVMEAKELLAAGFEKKSIEELLKLLEHPHQWVRQEAQFELAARKPADSVAAIAHYLTTSKMQIARLHCIWALGQIYRNTKGDPFELMKVVNDSDPIVRANVALTVAENTARPEPYIESLIKMLADKEPIVKFKAALGLASIGARYDGAQNRSLVEHVNGIIVNPIQLLLSVDKEPYLRHAIVMALTKNYSLFKIRMLIGTVPMGFNSVLVMRRLGLQSSLKDKLRTNPNIEAACAVYDDRMMEAMPMLASWADDPGLPDAFAYRSVAANFILGEEKNADKIADVAYNRSKPNHIRILALKLLADWPKPPRRDPITGMTIDLKPRDAKFARNPLIPALESIFSGSEALRKEAVRTVRKLEIKEAGPVLAKMVADAKLSANARVEALYALQELSASELGEVLPIAAMSREAKLKGAARVVRLRSNPKVAEEFADILDSEKTSIVEKQMMLAALGPLAESKAADEILADWLDNMIAGAIPAEVKLEMLEAATARTKKDKLKLYANLKKKLADYDAAVKKAAGDKLDKRYPEALTGGDAERGRLIFFNNAAVSCQKCHKVQGDGGEVGPPLDGIGKKQTRDYILESLLVPNAQIAEGYKSVILTLGDGRKVSGVLKEKTKDKYIIMTAEAKRLEIKADDVEKERPDKSAMPDDVTKHLSRREIRDLVEYLASLKE